MHQLNPPRGQWLSGAFFVLLFSFFLGWGEIAFSQERVVGEFIVKIKSTSGGGFHKVVAFKARWSNKAQLKTSIDFAGVMHFQTANDAQADALMAEMSQDPDVEYAEPNFVLKIADAQIESVAYDESQIHGIAMMGAYSQTTAPIQVDQAWTQMSSSSSVTPIVAIVDTGIYFSHPVFSNTNAVWNNSGEMGFDTFGRDKTSNGVDDDGNGFVDDWRGWNFVSGNNVPLDDNNHGTHCAGIALGASQDILSGSLSAAKIKIMPLKFLDSTGSGSTSNAINSIYYAVNNGAQVISNSWGGATYSQSLHDALKFAYDRGVVLVAAAGNSSSNIDSSPMYPASYPVPGQLVVAATSNIDLLASFSSYGAGSVQIAAPGVGIVSTIRNNSYMSMSGTSMATPLVAGAAALALRENSNLNSYQIVNLVKGSVDVLSNLSGYVSTSGRINMSSVVTTAKNSVGAVSAFGGVAPSYAASVPSNARMPASVTSESGDAKAAGCGSVAVLKYINSDRGSSGGSSSQSQPQSQTQRLLLFLLISLVPVAFWWTIKNHLVAQEKKQFYVRSHPRFQVHSDVKVKLGERELVGRLNSFSAAGASVDVDALLKKGGVMTIKIESPDGQESIEVEGRVVWSEEQSKYGVQFAPIERGLVSKVLRWSS